MFDLLGLYPPSPSFAPFLHPIEFSKSKSLVVSVVVLSKAKVCDRSIAGIAGANTDEGMDVHVCVCYVLSM